MVIKPEVVNNEIELERIVRQMRDRIYDTPIDDNGWERIKTYWLNPSEIQWLREHQP